MASIMISSFSIISVKDNGLLMPVLGSWVKNETGSVIIIIMYFYSASIQLPAQERFYE